jgi:hypothetical protein
MNDADPILLAWHIVEMALRVKDKIGTIYSLFSSRVGRWAREDFESPPPRRDGEL